MKFDALSPLPFGRLIAQSLDHVDQMSEAIDTLDGWSADFQAVGGGDTNFAAKLAHVQINGLSVSAVVHSPIQSKTSSLATSTIFVPFSGGGNGYRLNGMPVNYAAQRNGAFAPVGERAGAVGYRSMLLLDIDNARLKRTAAAMMGEEDLAGTGIDFIAP